MNIMFLPMGNSYSIPAEDSDPIAAVAEKVTLINTHLPKGSKFNNDAVVAIFCADGIAMVGTVLARCGAKRCTADHKFPIFFGISSGELKNSHRVLADVWDQVQQQLNEQGKTPDFYHYIDGEEKKAGMGLPAMKEALFFLSGISEPALLDYLDKEEMSLLRDTAADLLSGLLARGGKQEEAQQETQPGS